MRGPSLFLYWMLSLCFVIFTPCVPMIRFGVGVSHCIMQSDCACEQMWCLVFQQAGQLSASNLLHSWIAKQQGVANTSTSWPCKSKHPGKYEVCRPNQQMRESSNKRRSSCLMCTRKAQALWGLRLDYWFPPFHRAWDCKTALWWVLIVYMLKDYSQIKCTSLTLSATISLDLSLC